MVFLETRFQERARVALERMTEQLGAEVNLVSPGPQRREHDPVSGRHGGVVHVERTGEAQGDQVVDQITLDDAEPRRGLAESREVRNRDSIDREAQFGIGFDVEVRQEADQLDIRQARYFSGSFAEIGFRHVLGKWHIVGCPPERVEDREKQRLSDRDGRSALDGAAERSREEPDMT